MKKSTKILAIGLLVISVLAFGGFFYLKSMKLPVVEIGTIDVNSIRDGSYIGEYQANPVKVVVKVDVMDHKITAIKIEQHECGLGKKAEKITQEIEKLQSLNVDIVSGATLSSKVILKAVEVALEKGKE